MTFQSARQFILLFRSLFGFGFCFCFIFCRKKDINRFVQEISSFQCPLQTVYIGVIVNSEKNITYITKKTSNDVSYIFCGIGIWKTHLEQFLKLNLRHYTKLQTFVCLLICYSRTNSNSSVADLNHAFVSSQQPFTCSKLTIETLEKGLWLPWLWAVCSFLVCERTWNSCVINIID